MSHMGLSCGGTPLRPKVADPIVIGKMRGKGSIKRGEGKKLIRGVAFRSYGKPISGRGETWSNGRGVYETKVRL